MKKVISTITMMMLAMLAFTFTSCEDEEIAFVSHRFYRVYIIFFACSCASMTLSHHWSNSGSSIWHSL